MSILLAFGNPLLMVSLRLRWMLVPIFTLLFSGEMFILITRSSSPLLPQADSFHALARFMPGQSVIGLQDYPCLSQIVDSRRFRPISCDINVNEEMSITVMTFRGIVQELAVTKNRFNFDALVNRWGLPDIMTPMSETEDIKWPSGALMVAWTRHRIHAIIVPLSPNHLWNQDSLVKNLVITIDPRQIANFPF